MDKAIEELEHAATVFAMSCSPVERKQAEEKLLNFRRLKEPFDLCQNILEYSNNDCLLYEAARTLAEAVCRDWDALISKESGGNYEKLETLLLRLVDWVNQRQHRVTSYVKESVLRAVAALVKRSCAAQLTQDENKTAVDAASNSATEAPLMNVLLRETEKFMNSGDVSQQILSVSLLSSLLHEMSLTDNSCRMTLTWEQHALLRRKFEENEMPKIFMVLLNMAMQMCNYEGNLTTDTISELTAKVITSLEQVLTWVFLPKRIPRKYVGRFRNSERTNFRPNEKWKHFFADDSMVHIFFKLHMRVRQVSNLGVMSMMCLVQLSSLSGAVIDHSLVACDNYYASLVQALVTHVESLEPIDYEFPLFGELLSNLTLAGHLQSALQSSQALESMLGLRFMHCFAALIVKCIEGSALELLVSTENPVCGDTLDKLLTTWISLLSSSAPSYSSAADNSSVAPPIASWVLPSSGGTEAALTTVRVLNARIFDSYVRSHLAAQDGFRNRTPDGHVIAENDNSEIDLECEEEDEQEYMETLYAVGCCGREVLRESLATITHYLYTRINELETHGAQTYLLEDLHWLILIAGHLITQIESSTLNGGTNISLAPSLYPIPDQIMHHSLMQSSLPSAQNPSTNNSAIAKNGSSGAAATSLNIKPGYLEACNRLLLSAVTKKEMFSLAGSEDDVVKLIGCAYRLMWIVSNRSDSPQVAADIFWLMTRIVRSYFIIDESHYTEISPILLILFGIEANESCLNICVEGLINGCRAAMKTWVCESTVLERVAQLLLALTQRDQCGQIVMNLETWWDVSRSVCHLASPFDTFPMDVLHHLVQASIRTAKLVVNTEREVPYWNITLQPIKSLSDKILATSTTPGSQYDVSWYRADVTNCLILLNGVARGTRPDTVQTIFSLLMLPQLEMTIKLVRAFSTSSEVMQPLLDLFCQVTDNCLCYISTEQTGQLFQLVMNLVYAYKEENLDKRALASQEDEYYEDILLLINILTNLLAKEFIDFETDDTRSENAFPSAVEIVIYALNALIPLMNEEMLNVPEICQKYFRLVSYIAEINSGKVWLLPEDIFNALLQSIQLGLHKFSSDVSKMSLEFLYSLSEHAVLNPDLKKDSLGAFLPLLFTLFTQESFDLDVTDVASAAVLALICLDKSNYRNVVSSCLSSLPPHQGQRLCSCFETLTPTIDSLDLSRASKLAFIERFEKFILDARAFLCIY